MEGFQFIDIIFLAMVAGFIVLRLRSALGRRTGHEPPRDNSTKEAFSRKASNVASKPRRGEADAYSGVSLDIEPAYQGTPLESGLVQVKIADPSFGVAGFLDGASEAFEMIVAAYAKHDLHALKPLLSADVYSQFASAIQDREDRGETTETELIATRPPKLERIEMQDDSAVVGVRFQSEQVNIVKDSTGVVIDGDADHVTTVTDIWTFARDTTSGDPNWQLIATRSID
jgi:predicted lipid-binding transport protein (Tim44 family)